MSSGIRKALKKNWRRGDGYREADDTIVTWCVGHPGDTMSYPDTNDPALEAQVCRPRVSPQRVLSTRLLTVFLKRFRSAKPCLTGRIWITIYICTNSDGAGIYLSSGGSDGGVKGKTRKRVWIDSQTEEVDPSWYPGS